MATDEVVASARQRLLLDERLGRDTPVEVIRLAGVVPAPSEQHAVVVDLSGFDASAAAALRRYADQGLDSWLVRVVLEETGDTPAAAVARLLLAELGPGDLVFRLDAHEFVALVARDPEHGDDVADRLRRVAADQTSVQVSIDVTRSKTPSG